MSSNWLGDVRHVEIYDSTGLQVYPLYVASLEIVGPRGLNLQAQNIIESSKVCEKCAYKCL